MGDKRITADEAAKARKLIEKYDEQCHAERMKQWDHRNKWLAEMAGDFSGNAALEAWAEAKRESDKAKGIGTKMEPDMARAWNLKCLRNAVADVCQAFDIPVGEIVNHPRKETTNGSDAGRSGVTAMDDAAKIASRSAT